MSRMLTSPSQVTMWYSRMIAAELTDPTLLDAINHCPILHIVNEVCVSSEDQQRKVIDIYEQIINSFTALRRQHPNARVNFIRVFERMVTDVREFRVYHPAVKPTPQPQRKMTEEEYQAMLDSEYEDYQRCVEAEERWFESHG